MWEPLRFRWAARSSRRRLRSNAIPMWIMLSTSAVSQFPAHSGMSMADDDSTERFNSYVVNTDSTSAASLTPTVEADLRMVADLGLSRVFLSPTPVSLDDESMTTRGLGSVADNAESSDAPTPLGWPGFA